MYDGTTWEDAVPVLLVVDDEKDIRALISRYALHEGYQVEEAESGQQAIELCRNHHYDLVIMDIMMPGMNGHIATKEIRKEHDIPVLMLSARGEEYDKLFGFEMGVDDYVVKPFSPRELMARIKVIVSRHQSVPQEQRNPANVLSLGQLSLDEGSHAVTIGGKKVELTVKEYDILRYLLKNQNIALSRDQIMDAVWGRGYYGDPRTVDWQIKLLRSKLQDCRSYIRTLRGVGYICEMPS